MNISPEAKEAGMAECHDQTEGYGFHVQRLLAPLRAENARLAASVTELSAGALLSMTHQRDQLRSEVARLDEKLKEVEQRCAETSKVRDEWCAEYTKERDALRLAFAEASHNAGPAFVAHEELNRLKSEVAALTAECAERRTAAIASAERIASLGNERDESRIKPICAKHASDTEGDSYGVPGIITCVEDLEAKLTAKLHESELRNIYLAIEADLKYRESEASAAALRAALDTIAAKFPKPTEDGRPWPWDTTIVLTPAIRQAIDQARKP